MSKAYQGSALGKLDEAHRRLNRISGVTIVSGVIVVLISVIALIFRFQENCVRPFYFMLVIVLLYISAFFLYSVSSVGREITFFRKAIGSIFERLRPKVFVALALIPIMLVPPGLAIWKYRLKIGKINDKIASRRCDIEVAIPYLNNYPILGRNPQDKYYDRINDFNFPQVCVDKIFDFVYEDEIEDIVGGKDYDIVFAKSKGGCKVFYNVKEIIESFVIEANRARTAIYGFSMPAIQNIDFQLYQIPLYEGPPGAFKITGWSLEKLKSEGVPDDVLEKLKNVRNREFKKEETFVDTIKTMIGEEQIIKFKSLILKYSVSGKWIKCRLGKQLFNATRTTIEWMIDLLEKQQRTEQYSLIDTAQFTDRLKILRYPTSSDTLRTLRTCVYNSYSIITIRNFLKSLRYQAVSQLRDSKPREINLVELRRNLGERFFSFYLNNSPQTIEQQYDVDRIAAKLARYRALFLAGQHDIFLEAMRSDEGITGLFTDELIKKEIYGMKFVIYAARINYFKDIGPPSEVTEALHNMPDCIEKQVNRRLLLSHWPERFRSKLDSLETSIKSKTAKMSGPEREQMEYLLEISKLHEKIFGNDIKKLSLGTLYANTRIGRVIEGEDPYVLNIFILRDLVAFSKYRYSKLSHTPVPLIESLELYWKLSKSTRIPFLDNFRFVVEDAKGNHEVYGVDETVVTYLNEISGFLAIIPDSLSIPADIQQRIDNQITQFRQAIIRG